MRLQRTVDFLCGCSMRKTYMFYCNKHRKEIYLKIMKDSKYKNTRINNEVKYNEYD